MPSPTWADEIRQLYLADAANQFVIHGNVQDRLLLELPAQSAAKLGSLSDFLTSVQLQKFDLVFSYELGAGLRLEVGDALYQKLKVTEEFPKDPAAAIGFLDSFLRFVANVRKLAPGEAKDEGLIGRNHHIAIVIKGADLIFPISKQTRDYPLHSIASVVRSWSHESHCLEQNLAVFLIAENLNDLHHLLSQNNRAARIELPMPTVADLEGAFAYFAKTYPNALGTFASSPTLPAARLAGATVSSIESLLKRREHEKKPLVEDDFADLKKSLVERDAQGLIEFLEPTRTLDDVHGSEGVKTWLRQDIALWRQGDLGAMPMGYLLCGPVGTGKTYMVECLAGEAGVPVVKMKNFRDRWVGSTEGNLEKIFNLLHALGRCFVFVDEADQALGSRDAGSGDSGVSGRVYSMMAKEMSDPNNRGRIVWILASSRPDLIEVDLKRPGRVDVKIPLFPTATPEEGYGLIRALGKKHQLDLPKECPPALHKLIPNWITPGAAEAIAIKVYRCVRTAGDPAPDAVTALAESLKDYQNPVPPEVMRFQIGLAVAEASDLAFVPEVFRKLS